MSLRRLPRDAIGVALVATVGSLLLLLFVVRDVQIDWSWLVDYSASLQVLAALVAAALGRYTVQRTRLEVYNPEEAGEAANKAEAPAPADVPRPLAETAKVIADLAATAYAAEADQAKALDTKTLGLVAFTGAALLFAAGAVTKPPDGLTDLQKGAFVLFTLPILFVFVLALFLLFAALRLRSYQEVDLAQWARYSMMARPVEEVYAELASTFEDLVEFNHNMNASKAQLQVWGLRLPRIGLLLLTLLLAWLPLKWVPW